MRTFVADVADADADHLGRMFASHVAVDFRIRFPRITDQQKTSLREVGKEPADGREFVTARGSLARNHAREGGRFAQVHAAARKALIVQKLRQRRVQLDRAGGDVMETCAAFLCEPLILRRHARHGGELVDEGVQQHLFAIANL